MSTEETTPAAPAKKGKNLIQEIESVPSAIGVFIGKEAGIVGKLFSKEEPQAQADLKALSGVLQIIKTTVGEGSGVITYLIKTKYPEFTPDRIMDLLTKGGEAIPALQGLLQPTLDATLEAIQKYAGTLVTNDAAHANFWTSLFNVLGIIVSPGTPWGKVVTFGVYIYNDIY